MTTDPRSLRNEAEFLTAVRTVEGIVQLRDELMAAGARHDEASAIIGWLLDKGEGRDDVTSAGSRSKYRKRLQMVDPPNPGRGRRSVSAADFHARTAAFMEMAAAARRPGPELCQAINDHLAHTGQLIVADWARPGAPIIIGSHLEDYALELAVA